MVAVMDLAASSVSEDVLAHARMCLGFAKP